MLRAPHEQSYEHSAQTAPPCLESCLERFYMADQYCDRFDFSLHQNCCFMTQCVK
jgi:hypothetical protein